jgi:hypothetical protein
MLEFGMVGEQWRTVISNWSLAAVLLNRCMYARGDRYYRMMNLLSIGR